MGNSISGTYIIRARGHKIGRASTGTMQIGVAIEVVEGEHKGLIVPWYGFLNTDENVQRTMESLRALGWDGKSFKTLTGLGTKTAQGVLEEDEFEGQRRVRCAWVNTPGVAMKDVMEDNEIADLDKKFKKFLG